jgi:uncharacterized protein (UPF0332 family)
MLLSTGSIMPATIAVIAILIKHNISAHTHQGAKQMFSMHFIVTKKIAQKHSIFYSRLFNDRMSGDYDDFVQYDSAMLAVLRPQAGEFIAIIEQELLK